MSIKLHEYLFAVAVFWSLSHRRSFSIWRHFFFVMQTHSAPLTFHTIGGAVQHRDIKAYNFVDLWTHRWKQHIVILLCKNLESRRDEWLDCIAIGWSTCGNARWNLSISFHSRTLRIIFLYKYSSRFNSPITSQFESDNNISFRSCSFIFQLIQHSENRLQSFNFIFTLTLQLLEFYRYWFIHHFWDC
jgi:hypothetical protein